MSDMRVRWFGVWIVMAAGALAAGCTGKAQPSVTSKPQPNPGPRVASDVDVRLRDLSRRAEEYAADSRRLPGRDAEEHRRLMQKIFADLGTILPELAGPNPGRVFEMQLSTITGSRAQLADAGGLSPEPTIGEGLRAAADALHGIARNGFYDQANIGQTLDQLSAKVNDLDTVHGPMHAIVVQEAVDLSSQVISRMSDVLGQRLVQERQDRPPAPDGKTTPQPAPGGAGPTTRNSR